MLHDGELEKILNPASRS